MSEKSTRNDLDYAVESRAARNRSIFRPELQLCPCHTAEERYNLCESELKKEIPGNSEYGLLAEHVATLDLPLIQLVWFAAEA